MNYPLPWPKTEKQLLLDTITYYNSNNRSIEDGCCKYRTQDGKACAIGRYLTDEEAEYGDDNSYSVSALFIPRVHSKIFLSEIQRLHDGDEYWNEYGLTQTGLIEVSYICHEYSITFDEDELQLIKAGVNQKQS